MAAQVELSGSETGLFEISKIDITTNADEDWQPNGVRIHYKSQTKTDRSVFIYTESGNEAFAVRLGILKTGRLNCKVQLGTACTKYKIPRLAALTETEEAN